MKLFLWAGVFCLAGCSLVSNYDQLMVLKNYADNQRQTEIYVKRQERYFEVLRKDIQSGRLAKGISKQKVLNLYGEPILSKTSEGPHAQGEVLLYRHPTKFFNTEKVYLYFDQNGFLSDWKLEEFKKNT